MPRIAALAVLLAASMAGAAPHDLAPVASFHYQLQNLDVAAASASPFPLISPVRRISTGWCRCPGGGAR